MGTNLSVNYDASNNKVSQLSLHHRLLMQRKEELVKYDHARSYSRRSDEEKSDASLKMFEWQTNTHSNVRPRFRSMKEEILNNPYYKLTICEYEELELKTEIICKTWIRKKIKAKEKFSAVIGSEFNVK